MSNDTVKFLVVDDIEENLIALEALLRRDGLEILTASSGAQALELLLAHDVALAFLDVQMPEMDGFELAELMRGAERTKHVPIIFVTAGARDPGRVFKGYETGAVDFLYKPVEAHVLKGKADVFFELYRQRRELANALRLNELFVGILGHDLRNPLGAVLAGSQLLASQATEEKQQRVLKRMVSAGERMRDMIDQLLDLTRARLAGGLGFARARKEIDVVALIKRTSEELRIAHPERVVSVSQQGDSLVAGDPDRLLQLFSNIMANALQHGAPGSPVTVDVATEDKQVVVKMHNQGAIPPGLLPSIFDPFRGRQSKSAGTRGLGLGLFIAQQIALAHGGAISVASTPEAGTTFTVRLPVRQAKEVVGRSKTVLIVDDEEAIRESLREAFEADGYVAITAADGQEALTRLAEQPPDVVILDLVMPVLDGARVYQAMQADSRLARIPVIVSTSAPFRAPSGVVVMAKPIKLDRLLEAVAKLAS